VEFSIDLGVDVEAMTETLYEILAGGISINRVCETIDDSSYANTVWEHFTERFDLDTVEAVETCREVGNL